MRSIIAILLLCCYTISSSGIVVSKHFCGGELETISFYKKASSCCCGDEMKISKTKEEDDCCQDVESFSKLKTDQIIKEAKIVLANQYIFAEPLPIAIYNSKNFDCISQNNFTQYFTHPPPDNLDDKLYLKYRQLKLYDMDLTGC
jgi:hypothetical protein